MSKVDLLDNNWVDLVFEGRNKEYGAYVLRKETGKRNLKSMLLVFAVIIAIMASIMFVTIIFLPFPCLV